MKKLLALLLAMTMVFGLVACGGSEAPAEEAPAAEGSAAAPAEGGYAGESFTIWMATDQNENSDQAAPLVKFRDLVQEKSGGKVTVDVAWGGTQYDNAGIFSGLKDNLLSMDIMLMNKQMGNLPLMNWGFMPYSATAQESIDQTNYLLFENETTSKIIADYFAASNMTILGNSCDGAPSFVTTFAWEGLDDLTTKCSAFGTMNTAKYAAIGLNCTAVAGPELYDNLSRGIIDGGSSAIGGAITNSLYEVAPFCTVDGQYTSAVLILANTEFWNGLSAEAQALINECVAETSAFSAQYITESTAASAATWKEKTGNDVVFMGEEDGKALWAQTLGAIATNAAANAAGQAYEADMMTLLTEWVKYQEEYHGIDVAWEG